MTTAKRYTAIVEIVEVTETAAYKEYSNTIPASKDSRELAKFTVRDEQLEALKDKIAAHVSLV